MNKEKVLVIEDDDETAEFLKTGLELEGYITIIANCGRDGLNKLKKDKPDIILLDLGLPDIDGLEICKMAKTDAVTKEIPLIMLTARSATSDRVTGLEAGADDYIIKPFTPQELIARIKALFRRIDYYAPEPDEVLCKGGITLEVGSRKVNVNIISTLDLTPKEFELLYLLMKNSMKVVERGHLLKTLWGYDENTDSRTLDVHIRKLRKKLGEEAAKHIVTIEGVGFKFVS